MCFHLSKTETKRNKCVLLNERKICRQDENDDEEEEKEGKIMMENKENWVKVITTPKLTISCSCEHKHFFRFSSKLVSRWNTYVNAWARSRALLLVPMPQKYYHLSSVWRHQRAKEKRNETKSKAKNAFEFHSKSSKSKCSINSLVFFAGIVVGCSLELFDAFYQIICLVRSFNSRTNIGMKRTRRRKKTVIFFHVLASLHFASISTT